MKKRFLIFAGISLSVLACFIMVVACSNVNKEDVAKSILYMTAEEIGIEVGKNNPDLIKQAMPYYKTMNKVYEQGTNEDYLGMAIFGVSFILNKAGLDEATTARLKSKLLVIAALIGIPKEVNPTLEMIMTLDKGYIKEAIDGFMSGLEFAEQYR